MAPNTPAFSNPFESESKERLPSDANPEGDALNPPLKALFDLKYLRQPMSFMQWVSLLVYTPVGVCIAFSRVFLTAMLCLYANVSEKYLPWKMSDRTLFRIICIIAGVYHKNIYGRIPTASEMAHNFIVSNHTMTGDPGIIYFLYHKNAKVVHKSNVGSFDIITRHKILVGGDKVQVKKQILDSIATDPTPVVIYPEGATTNGNVGLLRFSSFIFGLDRNILPVGLRYYPALPFIPFHSVKPYYTFHMFLVAFQPWVVVESFVLPMETRGATETPETFAERVQKNIANAIGLVPTTYTAQDKTELRQKAKTN